MKTLADAHHHIQRKLTPGFLSTVATNKGKGVSGPDLVTMVNKINNELLNIKMAIAVYGGDFIIPANVNSICKEHRSLFMGLQTWRQCNSHFYTNK